MSTAAIVFFFNVHKGVCAYMTVISIGLGVTNPSNFDPNTSKVQKNVELLGQKTQSADCHIVLINKRSFKPFMCLDLVLEC